MLYERIGNLHIHTTYSDGSGRPEELAGIAARAGLDFLIITDHNAYVGRHAGWRGRTLLLMGEEVHARDRAQVNHFLAFGAGEQLAPYGDVPQRLIDAVRARGGVGFIAHPVEHNGGFVDEPEINWVDWQVEGYQGLELWNYMSEFKSYLRGMASALLYAYFPKLAITGPYAETLRLWDELLATRKVYAIGGTDAHAATYRLGPLRRQVFSYAHLFAALNTHILVPKPWSKDGGRDAQLVYQALAGGKSFVAYDGLAPARGFVFVAEHRYTLHTMGDEFVATAPVSFRVWAPARARLRLIQNGFCVAEATGRALTYTTRAPGVYRVEAQRAYLGKWRGWIYSNPIFVRV